VGREETGSNKALEAEHGGDDGVAAPAAWKNSQKTRERVWSGDRDRTKQRKKPVKGITEAQRVRGLKPWPTATCLISFSPQGSAEHHL
jgi:hypothetical protein